MLQTEVTAISDKQLLMHSCYIQQSDADVNSISGCSCTVSCVCRGKKMFSLLKQLISEKESGANIFTTSVINNVAEKLIMQMTS